MASGLTNNFQCPATTKSELNRPSHIQSSKDNTSRPFEDVLARMRTRAETRAQEAKELGIVLPSQSGDLHTYSPSMGYLKQAIEIISAPKAPCQTKRTKTFQAAGQKHPRNEYKPVPHDDERPFKATLVRLKARREQKRSEAKELGITLPSESGDIHSFSPALGYLKQGLTIIKSRHASESIIEKTTETKKQFVTINVEKPDCSITPDQSKQTRTTKTHQVKEATSFSHALDTMLVKAQTRRNERLEQANALNITLPSQISMEYTHKSKSLNKAPDIYNQKSDNKIQIRLETILNDLQQRSALRRLQEEALKANEKQLQSIQTTKQNPSHEH